MKKIKRSKFILILIIAVLLCPLKTTICPNWKIKIVNNQGIPIAGRFARQSWKDYSTEFGGSENLDDAWTDQAGYVEFPERASFKCLLVRVLIPVVKIVTFQFHSSNKPVAEITSWDKSSNPVSARYEKGKNLQEIITLEN